MKNRDKPKISKEELNLIKRLNRERLNIKNPSIYKDEEKLDEVKKWMSENKERCLFIEANRKYRIPRKLKKRNKRNRMGALWAGLAILSAAVLIGGYMCLKKKFNAGNQVESIETEVEK